MAMLVVALSLNACQQTKDTTSTNDRSTDTWSSSFDDQAEKLAFLSEYLIAPSEILDAEYHIVYHDNSGGLIPGPSDWDIRAVIKVTPEDIPLWTAGMNKLVPRQIDNTMWNDLQSQRFSWEERGYALYYKRPDARTYLVVYPYDGIIMKRISTMYISQPTEVVLESDASEYDEYRWLVLEKLGYDPSADHFLREKQAATGRLASATDSTVILYEMPVYGDMYHIPVMVIVSGNDPLCEVLLEGGYISEFFLADVDGDGYDEILIHHNAGGNGGAGAHVTTVYKLAEGKMQKLFVNPDYSVDEDVVFNTGFTMTLSDGWTHTVENQYTGYSHTFVREIRNENSYFDRQGNITGYTEGENDGKLLGIDPFFFIFKPVDVDNDGVFEIVTAQYTYLIGRSDCVGIAYTVLKWNKENGRMMVINANFWPDEEEYTERWQSFVDEWYMQ